MDIDTALLRAFVATAEGLHFGRAADRLHLSQQAVSKRITRLEVLLGVRLFERTNRRVVLSPAGTRLLPLAREALSHVDAALAAAGVWDGTLTVDVLNEHLPPLRMVHRALDRDPALRLQVTMRKDRLDAVTGLRAGEFDVAFCRAGTVPPPWPRDLVRAVLMLEPVDLLVAASDPLTQGDSVTMSRLRTVPLWFPAGATPTEWIEYLSELGTNFDLDIDTSGTTLGFEYFLSRISTGTHRATFVGDAMAPPAGTGLRRIRITDPVPVFPWWAVWRRHIPRNVVHRLLKAMADPNPTTVDGDGMWLPEQDRAYLAQDSR